MNPDPDPSVRTVDPGTGIVKGPPSTNGAGRHAVIEMEGVTHWFREAAKPSPVVIDFDLRVDHHEFVAIIGPSGCGKTTVLNMLAGLFPPEIGRCQIYLGDTPEVRPSTRI